MATLTRGFTLIEMLISLVIVSSAVLLATQAYRQYVLGADSFQQSYQKQLKRVQLEQLVIGRVQDAVLYFTKSNSLFDEIEMAPYWVGQKNSLAAVTRHSLQDIHRAAVFRLYVDGSSLIYCEKVIDTWLPKVDKLPEDLCNFSLSLEGEFSNITFAYWGWETAAVMARSRNNLIQLGSGQKPKWFTSYLGGKANLMPEWIKLSFQRKGEAVPTELMIPVKYQDPSRLSAAAQVEFDS